MSLSLREAAEKALEWIRDEGIEWIGKGEEVKKALRAALSDPYEEIAANYRKALAEAEAPKAEPVDEPFCYYAPDGTFRKHMRPTRFSEWPWSEKDYVPLYKHPPAREAEPVESAESELSDEEILALWQPPLEGAVQRPILGKNKILAFARAVLAHGR